MLKNIFTLLLIIFTFLLSCKPEHRVSVNHEFVTAAEKGDMKKIKNMVKNGVNVNSTGPNGYNALYKASQKGYLNIVNFLLNSGASMDMKSDNYHKTAIDIAALNGHKDIVRALLPFVKDEKETAFAAASAVSNNHYETALILLKSLKNKKVDLELALKNAVLSGDLSIIKMLVNHGANLNNAEILNIAAVKSNLDNFKYIIRKTKLNTVLNSNALIKSAHNGKTNIFVFLLSNYNFKNEKVYQAFRTAARSGNLKIVKELIKRKYNVNHKFKSGGSILFNAAAFFRHGVIKVLLKHRVNINSKYIYDKYNHNLYKTGFTPLMVSIKNNDKKSFKLFLRNINKANSLNIISSINLAVKNDNNYYLKKLLQSKVNLNRTGLFGKLPLNTACRKGSLDTAKTFIANGALVNIKDKSGQSPLSLAVLNGDKNLIKYLLDKNASLKYNTGTIIFNLVKKGDYSNFELLINMGLEINKKTAYKAAGLAQKKDLIQFLDFFRTRGINTSQE